MFGQVLKITEISQSNIACIYEFYKFIKCILQKAKNCKMQNDIFVTKISEVYKDKDMFMKT